jgi:hypothetical protein
MVTLLSIVARAFISSAAPAAVDGIAKVVGTLATERTKIMIVSAARMALTHPR